jgi:hypothetical protein
LNDTSSSLRRRDVCRNRERGSEPERDRAVHDEKLENRKGITLAV